MENQLIAQYIVLYNDIVLIITFKDYKHIVYGEEDKFFLKLVI